MNFCYFCGYFLDKLSWLGLLMRKKSMSDCYHKMKGTTSSITKNRVTLVTNSYSYLLYTCVCMDNHNIKQLRVFTATVKVNTNSWETHTDRRLVHIRCKLVRQSLPDVKVTQLIIKLFWKIRWLMITFCLFSLGSH